MAKIFIATEMRYSDRHGSDGGHLKQAAFHTREAAIVWLEANSPLFWNEDGEYKPVWKGDYVVDLNDVGNDAYLVRIDEIDTDHLGNVFIEVEET